MRKIIFKFWGKSLIQGQARMTGSWLGYFALEKDFNSINSSKLDRIRDKLI